MTAVRLAAPDLADHLVFGRDIEFAGPAVSTLTELLDFIGTRVPALA
jgi:putative hydrolase of the HAD superfamily